MKQKKQVKKAIKHILATLKDDPRNTMLTTGICRAVSITVGDLQLDDEVRYDIGNRLRATVTFKNGAYIRAEGAWKKRKKVLKGMLKDIKSGKWKP